MPPPSALKRKILLKNKRLKPDVEKMELELFLKGELQVKHRATTHTGYNRSFLV
jgi:phosphatidylinositol phospholipase C beta